MIESYLCVLRIWRPTLSMQYPFLLLLSCLLFVQLIYWIIILIQQYRYKSESGDTNSINEGVSIIICANNEIENLKKLIPVLRTQEFDNFEIIIVNDRSDDGTYDYLLGEKDEQLKAVHVDSTPDHINAKKYAITLGIKAAQHDIILLSDADCIPSSKQWVAKMTSAMSPSTNFALGYSQYQKSSGLLGLLIRFETRMTGILYSSFALAGRPYMGVGRNMAYRKSLFLEKKGFNKFQSIVGGDDDLLVNQYATKANTKVILGEQALIWSIPEKTWGEYFRQKIRHISVSKFYRTKDKMLLALYSGSHLLFWPTFVILAASMVKPEIVMALFAIRMIFLAIIINITSKNFGERINIWLIPFLDILYSFYLGLIGIASIFTKRVKWR